MLHHVLLVSVPGHCFGGEYLRGGYGLFEIMTRAARRRAIGLVLVVDILSAQILL